MSDNFDEVQIIGTADEFSQSLPGTLYCASFISTQGRSRRTRIGIVSVRKSDAEARYESWKRHGFEGVKRGRRTTPPRTAR